MKLLLFLLFRVFPVSEILQIEFAFSPVWTNLNPKFQKTRSVGNFFNFFSGIGTDLLQHFALVSDDFGHWAVVGDGYQSVPYKTPADIATTFFVKKKDWKKTIRQAIDAEMKEANNDRHKEHS